MPWNAAPAAGPDPQDSGHAGDADLSHEELAPDQAGPGPGSRMGMLTRAAAAIAAQAQSGPSSYPPTSTQSGPPHRSAYHRLHLSLSLLTAA